MAFLIVIADRNPQVAEEIVQIIAHRDIQCLHVDNAAELKQAIKSRNPSIIVLAPFLKDTPHWRATEKIIAAIKKSRQYSEIPVIFLKGYPEGPSESNLGALGADAYLSVPLDPKETINLIESFLQGLSNATSQIDDDDIVIDFDEDEEQPASYVEDKPMDLTSHSDVTLEEYTMETSSDQFESPPSLDLNEEFQLTDEPQELTDLSYQTANTMVDVESPPPLEPTDLEYTEPTSESSDTVFHTIQESLNEIGDRGESLESVEEVLPDLSHQQEEPTESAPPEQHGGEIKPQGLSEDSIDVNEVLLTSLRVLLPEKNAILAHVEKTIREAIPYRDELLALVGEHVSASLPSREEFMQVVAQRLSHRIPGASEQEAVTTTGTVEFPLEPFQELEPPPTHQASLDRRKKKPPEDGASSTSPLTIDELVKNIIHEKIDEIMPDRDKLLQWIQNEVDSRILETVEKIIKQKVEEITAGASYDGFMK